MHERGRPANEKPIDIRGNIKFTDDTDYWQANSFKFGFQNVTTFFKLGGDDVFIYGGVCLSCSTLPRPLPSSTLPRSGVLGHTKAALGRRHGVMTGWWTNSLQFCGSAVKRHNSRPLCSDTRQLRSAVGNLRLGLRAIRPHEARVAFFSASRKPGDTFITHVTHLFTDPTSSWLP